MCAFITARVKSTTSLKTSLEVICIFLTGKEINVNHYYITFYIYKKNPTNPALMFQSPVGKYFYTVWCICSDKILDTILFYRPQNNHVAAL